MFRVVAFAFSVDSRNGLGNAPSPPPWVTLKTSAPLAATIFAVDLGMISGSSKGNLGKALGSIVTVKLALSFCWLLKGSCSMMSFKLWNCAYENGYVIAEDAAKFLFDSGFEFIRVGEGCFENHVSTLLEVTTF